MAKILILGDGRLSKEIVKQTKWNFISRKQDGIDVRNLQSYAGYLKNYDTILNCIAYTNTYDSERKNHWDINYKAIADLADYCEAIGKKKLIHISTDYIYAGTKENATEEDIPSHAMNWYTYTKLLSDAHIQMRMTDYLLIRTSFKPRPYPYPTVPDQIGNFDYTDVIAGLIIKLIKGNANGIYNTGTKVKSIYDLASQTTIVEQTHSKLNPTMPDDISMNISKMENFLGVKFE